jgi:hypothetical protein
MMRKDDAAKKNIKSSPTIGPCQLTPAVRFGTNEEFYAVGRLPLGEIRFKLADKITGMTPGLLSRLSRMVRWRWLRFATDGRIKGSIWWCCRTTKFPQSGAGGKKRPLRNIRA